MTDSVKLLRRRCESVQVSDRVAVVRTFFDGSTAPKYSDFLPPGMERIVGTVLNVYSGTRVQVKWDIDYSISHVTNSNLEKVIDDCDEQGSAVQAAGSHALIEDIEIENSECESEDVSDERGNGKKKSKKKGREFRKKVGELARSDESDVEFEVEKKVQKKEVKEKKIDEMVRNGKKWEEGERRVREEEEDREVR